MNIAYAQRIREVFDAAVNLGSGDREALLDRECGSDLALRREIESLLRIDRREMLAIDRAMSEPLGDGSGILPSALPEKIGRFRILGLLGTGGMGVVYRARQGQPAREVALKTLRPGIATRRILARFSNEIATLGRLRHENIAQIYDAGTAQTAWGEQPYISMELVEGLPLLAFADRYTLDLRGRLELFVQLCEGVQFAHQQGVIHRDLKPANILVRDDRRDGGDAAGKVKILDFGVSRLIDRDAATQPSLATLSGELVGTIAYMSPEQLDGSRSDVDTRTDVYALGAILFELISGRPPVDVRGRTVQSVIRAVRAGVPTLPSCLDHRPALTRAVRGDLETIVRKTLEKEKSRRYVSAAALAEDVRRYLNREPIEARRASLWYVGRKFAARHRGPVILSLVAAVILAAGAAGTLWGVLRANAAATDKQLLLETAIETVSRIAAEVVPALNDVSGTAEVRRSLLGQLRSAYQTIESLTDDSKRLAACEADLLTAMSVLERTEGRLHDALLHRLAALRMRRLALAAEPGDLVQLRKLAMNTVLVGDCYKEQADRDTADVYYCEAGGILEALLAQGADSVGIIDDLVYSDIRLAENAIILRRADDARARLNRARTRCDDLERRGAEKEHLLNARQEILGQLGTLESRTGGRAARLEVTLQRINILRELCALAPSNVVYATSLARVLVDAAGLLALTGDCDGAARLLAEAEPICRRLRAENRRIVEFLDLLLREAAAGAKLAMIEGRTDEVVPRVRAAFTYGLAYGLDAASSDEAFLHMACEVNDLCEIAGQRGYRHLVERIQHEYAAAIEDFPMTGSASLLDAEWWLIMDRIAAQ